MGEAVTDYFNLKHGSGLFAQKSLEVLSTLLVCSTEVSGSQDTHLEAVSLLSYLLNNCLQRGICKC